MDVMWLQTKYSTYISVGALVPVLESGLFIHKCGKRRLFLPQIMTNTYGHIIHSGGYWRVALLHFWSDCEIKINWFQFGCERVMWSFGTYWSIWAIHLIRESTKLRNSHLKLELKLNFLKKKINKIHSIKKLNENNRIFTKYTIWLLLKIGRINLPDLDDWHEKNALCWLSMQIHGTFQMSNYFLVIEFCIIDCISSNGRCDEVICTSNNTCSPVTCSAPT